MRNYKFKGKNDNDFSSGVCTIICDATFTFGGDNRAAVADAGNTNYNNINPRPLETTAA